jgi:hypothetical protein
MQATIIEEKNVLSQKPNILKSSIPTKTLMHRMSTKPRSRVETCDIYQVRHSERNVARYTRDEFFAALSAASRNEAPVDDPRWQAIPREQNVGVELMQEARRAIDEHRSGESEPL